jgi:hypothetical protein
MCKEQASFVRQLRAAFASGSILTAEKQNVFGERLWWLLGGGLPLRESRIPEAAKRQVTKRCNGMCETCGSPMIAVENVGSGCNRPLHLRAVCTACSKTKSYNDADFVKADSVAVLLRVLAERVSAASPVRPCDDADTWDWRNYLAERRKMC